MYSIICFCTIVNLVVMLLHCCLVVRKWLLLHLYGFTGALINLNLNGGGVDLKDQLLHMYMVERKTWPDGTSGFSKGYWTLQFSIRLLFIDKWREEIYSSSRTEFGQWKVCSRNMRVLRICRVYLGERRLTTLSAADLKIFCEKSGTETEKSKPQRGRVVCSSQGIKKTSVYSCEMCDVGLCLEDCFELYHTKFNYWDNDNYFTASI